jgi:hypothetical protein
MPQVQYRKFWKIMDGKFFPTWRTVLTWAHQNLTVRQVWKQLPSILFQNFRYCTWGMRPRVIVQNEDTGCEHGRCFGRIFGRKTSCRNFL